MTDRISQRLVKLRKHLGERQNHELTQMDIAAKCGIAYNKIQRLENGLKGSMDTLIGLLLFYRDQGYNLDWILVDDNEPIPMMILGGNELLEISEEMKQMSQLMDLGYKNLNGRLRKLGYQPLEDKPTVRDESIANEAAGVF